MQTYDEMVDSGVEWLAKIPKQWKLIKIGYIANIDTGNSIKDEEKQKFEDNVDARPYISSKDINADTALASYNTGIYIPRNNNKFKVAPKGSTLLCIEGGSAGRKITYTSQEVSYVNKLCNFNAKKANQKFLYYYLRSRPFKSEFNLNITGLIGGVSKTKLASFKMALPSSDTQQKIADFLDQETAKIDNLIAKQERLLELLEEKRRATITHAVTCGLNPDVELKETNIPWLGRIPAHWSTEKIKYVAKRRDEKISTASGHKYIGLEHVESFTGKEISAEAQSEPEGLSLSYREGDVLFGKLRPYLAKVIKTTDNGICSSEFIVLSTENKILPEFLKYSLLNNRFIEEINSSTYGAKMPRANWDYIGNTYLPIPSIEEQQKITEFIGQHEQAAMKLKQKIQTQIKLLKERRTSLISHAVTGKVKV